MKKIFFILLEMLLILGTGFSSGKNELDKDSITIGFAIENLDDVFTQELLKEAQLKATELGMELRTVASKNNSTEQITQITQFIDEKINAIVVQLVNEDIASIITKKCVGADIPLVYIDRPPPVAALLTGKKITVVTYSNMEAGENQAKYVVDTLNARGITSGNMAILLGTLESRYQIERTKGIKKYLAANAPQFTITREQTANSNTVEAVMVVENWISSGDEFVAIFSNNDEMTLGASLVLREAGMHDGNNKILLVGFNAGPDVIAAIEKGRIEMSMFKNGHTLGSSAVKTAIRMIQGKTVNTVINIPFELVTKHNINNYK